MSTPITFVTWKWKQQFGKYPFRETYTAHHVNVMVQQLAKHCKLPHRVICITDDPTGVHCETFPLWKDMADVPNLSGGNLPSCYRRLKIFDPDVLAGMGIGQGTRVASIDIDATILNEITQLFRDRNERFVGWHVPGTRIKTVINGSMFMWTAGDLGYLWSEFNPETSPREACKAGYLGSDQAYLSYRLVGKDFVGKWTADHDGVLSFYRDIKARRMLPAKAKIVFFAGKLKPWHKDAKVLAPWVARYVDYNQKIVKPVVALAEPTGAARSLAATPV